MLKSIGSPLDNILWHKSISTNDDKPSFVYGDWMILYKHQWCITLHNMIVAYAQSFGASPCTVFAGEWIFLNGESKKWERNDDFFFTVNGSTRKNPYDLNDIGVDFFTRIRVNKPVWFIDPDTNCVEHSGAKACGDKVGKRYCWVCKKSFSGNNFVSQHGKVHKRKRYRDDNYADFLDAMVSDNL
tara:strand:- start:3113 stop:3667 length:555 start_codon:yes stop_codon:yes gene_type:complete